MWLKYSPFFFKLHSSSKPTTKILITVLVLEVKNSSNRWPVLDTCSYDVSPPKILTFLPERPIYLYCSRTCTVRPWVFFQWILCNLNSRAALLTKLHTIDVTGKIKATLHEANWCFSTTKDGTVLMYRYVNFGRIFKIVPWWHIELRTCRRLLQTSILIVLTPYQWITGLLVIKNKFYIRHGHEISKIYYSPKYSKYEVNHKTHYKDMLL